MYNRIGGDYGSTWDKVRKMKEYVDLVESDCVVATYHLMTETDPEKREVSNSKHTRTSSTLWESRQRFGRCITGRVYINPSKIEKEQENLWKTFLSRPRYSRGVWIINVVLFTLVVKFLDVMSRNLGIHFGKHRGRNLVR